MPVNIIVCAKQVVDPETLASAFKIDSQAKCVVPAAGVPPVINGFDENAVEAALRIKDSAGADVTVLSTGSDFALDVMKKPLSMGADRLVLVQDELLADLDASATAYVLAEAIAKLGEFDLIICGRQASDWDNASVPLALAEALGLPCLTVARKVDVADGGVAVERVIEGGYEVLEAALPAVVTVTNELGEPRYPTLRGIMAASRKTPTVWSSYDLDLDPAALAPKLQLLDLYVPVSQRQCEFIEGDDEADAGRKLALRLREEQFI